MIFNVLWTILLGVIGGIVSSLIVSRVFVIQGEYQQQLTFVAHILKKVNYISAYLQSAKAIFEVSYDQNLEIKREMQEKGYRTEMEYYAVHRDKDWIKKSDVLDLFKKEIDNTTKIQAQMIALNNNLGIAAGDRMKLKQAIIENFRSIKNCSIRFHELTAIVGENNSGKTGILHALNSVFNYEFEEQDFQNGAHRYAPRTITKITLIFSASWKEVMPIHLSVHCSVLPPVWE